jgi:aromatic ring-opening dioxygenase catalytic subunit (LigB family)
MPVVFIEHGSPMNGIEDNEFSKKWRELSKEIPIPNAVLLISAHWFTKGTSITAMNFPKTIHDFGGLPEALYQVQYPSPGNPNLAKETASMIHTNHVKLDHDWGLDHQPLIHYDQLGKEAMLAIPTPKHYLPLLYTSGLQGKDQSVAFFNDKPVGGFLTMTSVKIG